MLSAIVFIVAGPALGLTLAQFHRGIVAIYTKIRLRQTEKSKTMESLKHYALICIGMTDNERKAFDETKAWYDFCISTGISLFGLSALGFFEFGFLRFEPWTFLIGGIVLLATGYLENTNTYTPLYLLLENKYAKKCK